MNLLYPYASVTSCIGHLKNTGSLSCERSAKYGHISLYSTVLKFANIRTDLIREVFIYWQAVKLMVVNASGPPAI